MDKKAQFEVARKTIYWMIAGLVITIVIFAFSIIIAKYSNDLTKTPVKLKAELISSRFINSPDCFAYQDPITKRVYPGVIDWEKYNQKQLNFCYDSGENHDIFNFGMDFEETEDSYLKTKEKYKNLDSFTLFKTVLIRENGKLRKDTLRIYVREKI